MVQIIDYMVLGAFLYTLAAGLLPLIFSARDDMERELVNVIAPTIYLIGRMIYIILARN